MREKVLRIITQWDPIDLSSSLVPEDEYVVEVEEIVNVCNKNISQRQLSKIIYNVFLRNFGESIFKKSIEECEEVANEIFHEKDC